MNSKEFLLIGLIVLILLVIITLYYSNEAAHNIKVGKSGMTFTDSFFSLFGNALVASELASGVFWILLIVFIVRVMTK